MTNEDVLREERGRLEEEEAFAALPLQDRLDRLSLAHAEGRLIRGEWTGLDAAGRETMCPLTALAPECGFLETEAGCPSWLMPPWFAAVIPRIADSLLPEDFRLFCGRLLTVAPLFGSIDDRGWRRVWMRTYVYLYEVAKSRFPGFEEVAERLQLAFQGGGHTEARKVWREFVLYAGEADEWANLYPSEDTAMLSGLVFRHTYDHPDPSLGFREFSEKLLGFVEEEGSSGGLS